MFYFIQTKSNYFYYCDLSLFLVCVDFSHDISRSKLNCLLSNSFEIIGSLTADCSNGRFDRLSSMGSNKIDLFEDSEEKKLKFNYLSLVTCHTNVVHFS